MKFCAFSFMLASRVSAFRWPLHHVRHATLRTASAVVEAPRPELPKAYQYGDVKSDEQGLPLVYEPEVIQSYWNSRPREMANRWTYFAGLAVPFFGRVARSFTAGTLEKDERPLARELRIIIEKMGPTFIKLGQALSIRPDVIGPVATEELAMLQDAVQPFPHEEAMNCLTKELGRPISEVFSEMGDKPVAAASLAQVYRAKLRSTGQYVAVKIQRPGLLPIVTRDLYVLRRAVTTYQDLSRRWTKQTTDYLELLRVWATGFYQELDFLNEANNQIRMRELLADVPGVTVPRVLDDFTTRRLLVSEWVDGVKLTQCDAQEIRALTKIAQEAFLKQMLEVGFMHADPHPGNILCIGENQIALLDFGLVTELAKEDRDVMVNALIHTANKDFPSLIDDMIDLKVLPRDTDRGAVEPVMRRVIGPYVFNGGGARSLNFQSLARDLGRATLEIPFSIPPYFALVARAIGILEGIALSGDPNYRMVLEAYPYVARRVMSDDSPALQRALRELLVTQEGKGIDARRLSNLLAYAAGAVAADSAVFVDFDADVMARSGADETLALILSEQARPLRNALEAELADAADLALRRASRRAIEALREAFRPPPPPLPFLPRLPAPPLPLPPPALVDALAPRLTLSEEIFLASATDLAATILGVEPSVLKDLGEMPFRRRNFREMPDLLAPFRVLRALADPAAAAEVPLLGNFGELSQISRLLRPGTPESAAAQQMVAAIATRVSERARDRWETYVAENGNENNFLGLVSRGLSGGRGGSVVR